MGFVHGTPHKLVLVAEGGRERGSGATARLSPVLILRLTGEEVLAVRAPGLRVARDELTDLQGARGGEL